MRTPLLGTLTAVALLGSVLGAAELASGAESKEPESCLALNPVQPRCTFTITTESTSQTVTGAVGAGTWKVIVKRGKQKSVIAPSSTQPEPIAFNYEIGDKVTATTSGAGSWVLAGHD